MAQARKKLYEGHHECPWHEVIDERLKGPIPTLCRNCFNGVRVHQVQLIGALMVNDELLMKKIRELEKLIFELERREPDHG